MNETDNHLPDDKGTETIDAALLVHGGSFQRNPIMPIGAKGPPLQFHKARDDPPVSASLAFRVARLVKVGIDDLLAGKYPPAGACPHCGHVKEAAEVDQETPALGVLPPA